MCVDPVTAISIFTTVAGFIGDSQAADDQDDQILEQQRLNNEALLARQQEVNEDATKETSEATIEARKKRATLRVAAGESGLTGNFIDTLEGGVAGDLGRTRTNIEKQRKREEKQTERELRGVKSRAQSDLNSVQRPSIVGAGLQIAGSVMGQKDKLPTQKVTTFRRPRSVPFHPSHSFA